MRVACALIGLTTLLASSAWAADCPPGSYPRPGRHGQERQAQLAVKSEYWLTGEWCRQRKRSDVPMNTEMRTLDDDPDYAKARKEKSKPVESPKR